MIQRKQTIFLFLAFVLVLVCMSMRVGTLYSEGMEVARVYNMWLSNGQGGHSFATAPMMALLLPAALLSLVTIFLFKKRVLQARLCLLGIVLLVAWYVCLAVIPTKEGGTLHLEWPAVLPAVSIILLFMARRGVLADEKLVRSMDRIR